MPGSAPPSLKEMSERQIIDQMKRQTQTYQRISTLEELMRRAHIDGQAQQSAKEFISKGGVQILQQWSKEIKDDVLMIKQSQQSETQEQFDLLNTHKNLFFTIIDYLDLLPIDWSLLKKTKVGKAINSALKA